MPLTRRYRRAALECQHFASPDSGDDVIHTFLPLSHFTESTHSNAAGTIIQWVPPLNTTSDSYQYDFDSDGLVTDGPVAEPGSNPVDLDDPPVVEPWGYDGIGIYSDLRTLEFIAENTDSYDPAVAAVSKLSILVNYNLGASSGLQFTVPIHLAHAGDASQFIWDMPASAVFNFASIIATEMRGLRLTIHAVTWPLA